MAEYIKAMRALFRFAKDSQWFETDPTEDIKAKHVKTDGYHTWTVEEVARYHARHPAAPSPKCSLHRLSDERIG